MSSSSESESSPLRKADIATFSTTFGASATFFGFSSSSDDSYSKLKC